MSKLFEFMCVCFPHKEAIYRLRNRILYYVREAEGQNRFAKRRIYSKIDIVPRGVCKASRLALSKAHRNLHQ